MVVLIISSGYPFLSNVVLIWSNSSVSLDLKQVISARWTNVYIKLTLCLRGQNDPHRVYEPVERWLMIDGSLYTKISLLNGDIKKWKAIVILKFASERQRWVELVNCL